MPYPLVPSAAFGRVGIGFDADWQSALEAAADSLIELHPDLLFTFCDSSFAADLPAIAATVWRTFGAPLIVGASGCGLIAHGDEYERQPGIVLLAVSLPGAILSPVRLSALSLEGGIDPESFRNRIAVLETDVNGWVVLGTPFRFNMHLALDLLTRAYPATPIIGGIASPNPESRQTALLLNGEAHFDGAIALGIGGPYHLMTAISHGADPIGDPWTITRVDGDWIEEIGGRPAIQVLDETMQGIPDELRIRTHRNLLIGLALDEYVSDYTRGDFLVRGLAGIDQVSGAIAVGAPVRVGQTMQFQVRNAATADLDLTYCLDDMRMRLAGLQPVFGLGFSGHERGADLFGSHSHDARAIQKRLPGLPVAGISTAGEVRISNSPVAIHCLTLTMGLIVRQS